MKWPWTLAPGEVPASAGGTLGSNVVEFTLKGPEKYRHYEKFRYELQ